MYRFSLFGTLLLLVLTLNACNLNPDQPPVEPLSTDQPSKEGQYLPLSTKDNGEQNTEEPLVNLEEAAPEPGYAVPQERPSEQADLLKSTEQYAQQIAQTEPLPFEGFKERWNAVSKQQGTDLIISHLDKSTNEKEDVYQASLTNHLTLRVFVAGQHIQKIQMSNEGKTTSERYTMLMGWSQVFFLFHPNAEPHHVDNLFTELGVGPNANLSQVEKKTVLYQGVQYTVSPTEIGYELEVAYPLS
ncbi:hypothetical protein [Bacillus sp. REN10]|uniref:hypothetical protein n=1 Tax=Bacillus sp. REN10 TaxID=2782541 RepID=UPI00193BB207|nr:hypothetical protein [Bacillus sp. REN10]